MLGLAVAATILIGTQRPASQTLPRIQTSPGQLSIQRNGAVTGVCPLKGTEVDARIEGFGARVSVRQTFVNPTQEAIEAIYTFPLPADAAVDTMKMRVGTRLVDGAIKRREEARQIYEQAKQAGQTASLLDQERSNIFTQSVANIMPGAQVSIEISYVQLLKFDDGWFEFMYPMVVGQRYVGAGVKDGNKINPPVAQGTRSGSTINLSVSIDAGVPVDDVQSVLHEITTTRTDSSHLNVSLSKKDEIPNRDFILRFRPQAGAITDGFLAYADPRMGGYFSIMLLPPRVPRPSDITPKEVVFVVDQSGSQNGFPIEKSKELTLKLIESLNPGDTFNVMGFSNDVNKLWAYSRNNDAQARREAREFVSKLQANGGTELQKAVVASLTMRPDPSRLRIVVFNSDGYVGGEANIFKAIREHRGNARMFTFGIGNSVNRMLVDGMSREGKGNSETVTLASDADQAVQRFIEMVDNPLLTDIKVRFDGVAVKDVLPREIPDVFSVRPVVIKGRYEAPGQGRIVLSGKLGGQPWSRTINVTLPSNPTDGPAVATLWARERIEDLSLKRMYGDQFAPELRVKDPVAEITKTALAYNLVSEFTSFVAVEKMVVNFGGKVRTIPVPVDAPAGTSFSDAKSESLAMAPASATRFRGGGSAGYAGGAGGAGGFGGGGGGFGTGGSAGGPPATTAGVVAANSAAAGKQIKVTSADANKAVLAREKQISAELKKSDDRSLRQLQQSMSAKDEAAALEKLTPAEREKYFIKTRLSPKLQSLKGSADVMIRIKRGSATTIAALKKIGLKIVQSDARTGVVFVTADLAMLKKVAAVAGVVTIDPIE